MELQTIDDLFGKYSFETPDYQRGFAWGTEQVRDFWDDISRIGITNPQHFTGTLILEAVPNGISRATVVDGQQRLTTVVLLAAAIAEDLERREHVEEGAAFRKSFLGDANSPSFRYAEAHDSWPYLALHVYKNNAFVARAAEHGSAYTKNIHDALNELRSRVENLSSPELDRLIACFHTKIVFNVVAVDPGQFNIHIAFETINNRGKHLTKLELLKNRLIYLTSLLPKLKGEIGSECEKRKAQVRSEINVTWSSVYSWLGKEGVDVLDEEEFLRVHSMAYFEVDTGEKNWLEDLIFKKVFSAESISSEQLSEEAVIKYLQDLQLGAVLWSHIRRPRAMPIEQIVWLNRINHVRRPLFDPLILAAYTRLVRGRETMATDLRLSAGSDGSLIELLMEIERFLVLVFLVTGRRSHTARKEFASIAHELHSKTGPFEGDVQQCLGELAEYVRSCTSNGSPPDSDTLLNPKYDRIGYLDIGAFAREIAKQLRHGEGYYGLEWTKVLLFEYEESLRAKEKGVAKVEWDRVSADSIEHIYPQDDTHWESLTNSIGDRRSKAKINSYKHSLGNLLLLSRNKNSSLKNLPYSGSTDEKGKKPRFAQGSFSENEVAQTYKLWTSKAIFNRGKRLLEFAEERWDFSFGKLKAKELLLIE